MRKLILLLMLCFFMVPSANAMLLVEENDKIIIDYGNYHEGNGGEFAISGTNSSGVEYWYTSFCLEKKEYFNPGKEYTVSSVADYAESDSGVYSSTKDQVSNATKWLMNEYISNYNQLYSISAGLFDDSNYTNNYTKTEFAGDVQNAIWYLEDEISVKNDLVSYMLGKLGFQKDLYTDGYMDWVKVVNLVTMDDDSIVSYHQSQLVAAPVPEPATMLLLGTGLIGLAGLSRKKFKS